MTNAMNIWFLVSILSLSLPGTYAIAGPGSDGGGSSVEDGPSRGALFDRYLQKTKFKVEEQSSFKNSVQPMLRRIESELPDLARELKEIANVKSWHLVDAGIPNLPKDATKIIFQNATRGYQTGKYVFIDKKWFESIAEDDQALFLQHELVQGMRLKNNKANQLKFAEIDDAIVSNSDKRARLEKMYIVAPDVVEELNNKLASGDYENAHELLAYLRDNGFRSFHPKRPFDHQSCFVAKSLVSLCDPGELEIKNKIVGGFNLVRELQTVEQLGEVCESHKASELAIGQPGAKKFLRILRELTTKKEFQFLYQQMVKASRSNNANQLAKNLIEECFSKEPYFRFSFLIINDALRPRESEPDGIRNSCALDLGINPAL